VDDQPIDLGKEVDALKFECIREIADAQDPGATTYQAAVPAQPGGSCPTTVPVSTVAYTNIGKIKWTDFGETSGKKHGFVVAKITNRGSCPIAGNIDIPAYTTVYWIVEFKPGARGPSARIILADGSGDLDGKKRFRFGNCGNENEGTADQAFFKFQFPCDGIHYPLTISQSLHERPAESKNKILNFADVKPGSKRAADPTPGLWMPCGGDCCFTDG
jgi:hypothetical protein